MAEPVDTSISAPTSPEWLAANQRYLSLRLAAVRSMLLQHAVARGEASVPDAPSDAAPLLAQSEVVASEMLAPPALLSLSATFGLTSFETFVLLLCAGVELDARIGSACARAHGDSQRPFPTFGLALAALPDAHWSALTPDAALRRWQLIEFENGPASPATPITGRPLRIDERMLHAVVGLPGLDARLASVLSPALPAHHLVPSHRIVAARVARAWQPTQASRPPAIVPATSPVIVLYGPDVVSARAVAASASRACSWPLMALSDQAIPTAAGDRAALAAAWNRELRLSPRVVMVECDGAEGEAPRSARLADWVDRVSGPVVVLARERVQLGQRPALGLEVTRPAHVEQRELWETELAGAMTEGLDIGRLTSQFCLNASEVHAALEEARLDDERQVTTDAVWGACRRQVRGRLDDLAQRIESPSGLDDLILPDRQKDVLAEVVTHVKHRPIVYDEWGFGGRGTRGLGISALFAGTSGTGKTMAAEVLANALQLDLYRVDLSSVVSKYIGETEKNIRRIFDAADAGGAVLLFDEADALFGKRTEVKDSHDRHANVEVSYLLQRIESYRGLAILTTNLKSALDTAFLRRIRFIVEFPFPDATQRARIWERAFPSATPTRGLDLERLAQLSVAGGGIKNVALGAAFLAADSHEPVGMAHVLHAARSEYAKLEKSLTDAEVAGWMDAGAPC
jgi:hypothetical protein